MSADSIEKIAEEIDSAIKYARGHGGQCVLWESTLEQWAKRLRALPSLAELERDAAKWKRRAEDSEARLQYCIDHLAAAYDEQGITFPDGEWWGTSAYNKEAKP